MMKGKMIKEKVMKEKGKDVERKSEKKRRLNKNKKWRFFGWILLWEKCEERKRINKEFQKVFKNKRISHTHFFKKKKKRENRKRKKEKLQKEKNRRCLLRFVGKDNIFSDTSKQERNKWETECLKEEKENNKGELRQKRETISQNRKTRQSRKNRCETCPTRKETNKIVFLVKRRKQEKKVKETIQDQEK